MFVDLCIVSVSDSFAAAIILVGTSTSCHLKLYSLTVQPIDVYGLTFLFQLHLWVKSPSLFFASFKMSVLEYDYPFRW